MEGYVILFVVFLLLPALVIGSIWWGVSRVRTEALLVRLSTLPAVEERLARTRNPRMRFTLVSWEYLLATMEGHGRTTSEIQEILQKPKLAEGLKHNIRQMRWALRSTAVPIVVLVGALVLVLLWMGLLGISSGDYTNALFIVAAAIPIAWAVRLIRVMSGTALAWQGRSLLALPAASAEERVAEVRRIAGEHVVAVRSVKQAEARQGFSQKRQTVTENIAATNRLSNKAWRGALLAGGGLTLLRLVLRLVEAVAPSGPAAVGATLGAIVVLVAAGWFGWRAWYGSARGREQLLGRLGAVKADTGELRSSWRALEQVAAAAGLADPPALWLIDAPVLNAAVAGTTAEDAAFIITDRFAELPQAEQQAALAMLMAHVVSGRAAKAATPRGRGPSAYEDERTIELSFAAADEVEGLQLTRSPQAHVALLERMLGGEAPTHLLEWAEGASPFADRRLWYYAPSISPVRSMQIRLAQLRSVLGAEALSHAGTRA